MHGHLTNGCWRGAAVFALLALLAVSDGCRNSQRLSTEVTVTCPARSNHPPPDLRHIEQALDDIRKDLANQPKYSEQLTRIERTLDPRKNAPPPMWGQSFLFTVLATVVALMTYISTVQQNLREKIREPKDGGKTDADPAIERHSWAIFRLALADVVLI